MRTINGGIGWGKAFQTVKEDLSGVYFIKQKTGFAVGANGMILRSDTSGAYWEEIESGTRLWLEDIKFLDEKRGVIVGDKGTILLTDDGGYDLAKGQNKSA